MFTGNFQTPADDIGPGILTGTATGAGKSLMCDLPWPPLRMACMKP